VIPKHCANQNRAGPCWTASVASCLVCAHRSVQHKDTRLRKFALLHPRSSTVVRSRVSLVVQSNSPLVLLCEAGLIRHLTVIHRFQIGERRYEPLQLGRSNYPSKSSEDIGRAQVFMSGTKGRPFRLAPSRRKVSQLVSTADGKASWPRAIPSAHSKCLRKGREVEPHCRLGS
jgi:hypothetical protein